MLCGEFERFLAPLIIFLVEFYDGRIRTPAQFVQKFDKHFMAYSFPLYALYSGNPGRMLVQQHGGALAGQKDQTLWLFQLVMEQALRENSNFAEFGIAFVRQFIYDVLSFRYG